MLHCYYLWEASHPKGLYNQPLYETTIYSFSRVKTHDELVKVIAKRYPKMSNYLFGNGQKYDLVPKSLAACALDNAHEKFYNFYYDVLGKFFKVFY